MADRGRTVAWPTPTAKTALGPSPIHCLFPAPCPQRILSICLWTLLHSDCLLQNTTRPPSLRPVRCRPKEEARKFASYLGWGARLWAGQPAMTFADGIGNLSSRKKEPTHAFNERALPNLLRVVLDANTHSLVVREHPYYSLPSCHAPPRVGGGSSTNSRDKFSKMNH